MLSLVRVDDRLLHGQITVGWVPYLRASQILVANDRLAGAPVLADILRAASTEETAVDVVSVERCAELFDNGRLAEERVIVLLESLVDARRALEAGMKFSALNLGGIRRSGAGLRVTDAVVLSEEDQQIVRDLSGRGVAVEVRLMPGDRPSNPLEVEV